MFTSCIHVFDLVYKRKQQTNAPEPDANVPAKEFDTVFEVNSYIH